jgi:segregation and condensation protein A
MRGKGDKLIEERPGNTEVLRIRLEGFEGPLDLLLHLIRKHELEITEIPIAFITEEYLAYLDAMNQLDLSIAGEYLVMAATLLHIKSKELVPADDEEDDEFDEDFDPREDLVRRLLEYQKYRDAASRLDEREKLGDDVFARPSRADRHEEAVGPAELLPVDLFQLLDVYRELMSEQKEPAVHEVTREELSLKETIGSIAQYLSEQPKSSLLDLLYALDERPSIHRIVVTFMGLLEMAKMKLVRLFQARLATDDLIIERAVVDIEEVSQTLQLSETWDDSDEDSMDFDAS